MKFWNMNLDSSLRFCIGIWGVYYFRYPFALLNKSKLLNGSWKNMTIGSREDSVNGGIFINNARLTIYVNGVIPAICPEGHQRGFHVRTPEGT